MTAAAMSKERIVMAAFSNGRVFSRGSKSRVYTHAYLAIWKRLDGSIGEKCGFSTSEQQCRANMESETAWLREKLNYEMQLEEVVAIEVIDKRTQEASH